MAAEKFSRWQITSGGCVGSAEAALHPQGICSWPRDVLHKAVLEVSITSAVGSRLSREMVCAALEQAAADTLNGPPR